MPTDDFTLAIQPLKQLGGQRVWSLMISLFGDLARHEGDVIDGPVLSAIMAAMDVRPEAARVALHRLRKDNWIASQKHGRTSQHSLTTDGRRQSHAASRRIYASPDDLAQNWQMVLTDEATSDAKALSDFVNLEGRIYVGAADLAPPKNAFAISGKDAPDWMKRELEPQQLAEGYVQLRAALEHAVLVLPPPPDLVPREIATLRCLVVHNWRRLALKHPAVPRPLIRDDWPGLRCHVLVADLLARYPRPQQDSITAV